MTISPIQKRNFIAAIFVLLITAAFSCSKYEEKLSPEAQVLRYLTGTGNRYWRIKELYVNGVKQNLTSTQLTYNKTYTVSIGLNAQENVGTWTDADGFAGSWQLQNVSHIAETVQNGATIPPPLIITINKIGPFDMDVEYTQNNLNIRTVYFAY